MRKDLSDYNIRDAATVECPYSYYAAMRQEQPVHQDPRTKFYIVSKYKDIIEVLRNPTVYSSAIDRMAVHALNDESILKAVLDVYRTKGWEPLSILDSDPPIHTRFRELVKDAFSPARVERLVPQLTQAAEELVDKFIEDGTCEFVRQFGRPFPLTVMADLLGIARDDMESFRLWSDAYIDMFGRMASLEYTVACAELTVEMQHYLAARIEERKIEPKDDVLTDLVRARYEGKRPMTMEEMLAFSSLLVVAGNHTTSNAFSNSLFLLLQNPDTVSLVESDPARLRAFIEESLRVESPVQGELRIVTEDTVLAGTTIPKGAVVNFRLASANRDEEKFVNPDVFDIHRKNVDTHLAFGAGIHHCLGAPLARAELRIGYSVLLRRLKNMRLLPGKNSYTHTPNAFLRGVDKLYITFERR